MGDVRRVYVEKKEPYAVRAKELKEETRRYLGLETIKNVRVLIRYDVENISETTWRQALGTVFSEPPLDHCYEEHFEAAEGVLIFSVEYLPGQFDQRADSAEQCIKLLNEKEEPVIRSATTYVFEGGINEEEARRIKDYCINPVDSREAAQQKPETLVQDFEEPADIAVFEGFQGMGEGELQALYDSLNLAMTFQDFRHIQNYFAGEEKRDPSVTEIRVLDTYWSDHCRHTTFLTELKNIAIQDGYYKEPIQKAYDNYTAVRKELYKDRPDKYISLMDIALLAMRKLKADGKLNDMEESDEINACSIVVPVEIDGKQEEWLVFFKNETHNHPTEIEPFGGAATCLGGAIRDPLSGRGYVYQAMRVTGAGDPTVPIEDTLEGKLPQKKIVTGAAQGYSSYGNQIGLATGLVREIYHPNYVAKRMEIGAVMGAAPRRSVTRGRSMPGDMVILLGGRTGRDGIGGATGSSKAHTAQSIDVCGAEVQKGNAPTERKIQRLFRRGEVSSIIKKCNDFGAGGVSVAIGELADGLSVNLDRVPKKYAGLDGTELSISESQERMAVVVAPEHVDSFLHYAEEENLEAVVVAEVTETPRLVLSWRGKAIVDISRAFLDTNGAHQETDVQITVPSEGDNYWNRQRETSDLKKAWLDTLHDLNVCSQKGLVEMFDSSIGASTVLMPHGGKTQLTPVQVMAAKLPVLSGKCDTVTMMSYGMDPYLTSWSPYHGAVYAVVSSVAKIVAAGGDYRKIRFTFQEYFRRLGTDPTRWGEPMAALLGAYDAQMKLGLASIGGKDSMSGTFDKIDVPPTLCSFAVDVAKLSDLITPELKKAGNILVKCDVAKDAYSLPDYGQMTELYGKITALIHDKVIVSAYAIEFGGLCEAVSKMAFGNGLGVTVGETVPKDMLFAKDYGSILVEIAPENLAKLEGVGIRVGTVTEKAEFVYGDTIIPMTEALESWEDRLESVFPTHVGIGQRKLADPLFDIGKFEGKNVYVAKNKVAKPTVFLPVFPGTNCEYDTQKAFECAGATVKTLVFKNLSESQIVESVDAFRAAIDEAQILMLSGGFSAGDEPDGSAKFIASVFRNPKLTEAVHALLQKRDGLVLGICNGFQALIKLGLVPYGEICPQEESAPTLTTNMIGRHVSKSVYTKVCSNKSPWLQKAELGGVYVIPASHGEGRFVASFGVIKNLFENGQVATRYVDREGCPTTDERFNPNDSYAAIEGITSPDGRVLGKMAHSERIGDGVAINIYGNQNQHLFESGVAYFQ